jgi:nicotinate dehydrogenase subunit B
VVAEVEVERASGKVRVTEDIPAKLEVELINRPDQPSVGAGEGATCPLAAAIANAICDATGARLRQYPFTPSPVKAALTSA